MPEPPTSTRDQTLQRLIRKLTQQIDRLEAVSRRFVWVRLGVILLGGMLIWAASSLVGSGAGWIAFIITVLAFVVLVYLHRRLARWIEKFSLYGELKSGQLARLTLAWEGIPAPSAQLAAGQEFPRT